MQAPRYCIYNETNECFLSLGTRLGCDPFAPLKRWFRTNSDSIDEGFWLSPLRRLKTLGIVSFHDLVYLDDHQRVVDVVESFSMPRLAPKRDRARSLLVLPEHTISASSTQIGNQLVICPPEEMEAWLRKTLDIKFEDSEPDCEPESCDAMQSPGQLSDRRASARMHARSLCAHYRHQGSRVANGIRDIGGSGLYLVTKERWPLGTRVSATLELVDTQDGGTTDPIQVQLQVARWGPDGLGLESVSPQHDESNGM